ncbi:hypothetical protein CKQ79_29690, partial [Klebsiella pneumoniae]
AWGGITPTMKVAALAESFGMDCEVHGNGAASLATFCAPALTAWGGITPTMKVAALAESFGMDCEVHGNGAASLA